MIERFTADDGRVDADATRDALTGTLSRRGLAALIARIAASTRHGGEITLLMIDIDGLATLDRLHGAGAGDQARVTIAHRLRLLVAPHDRVARVAQDVFACLLCHHAGAPVAIDTAREMIAAIAWPVDLAGTTVTLRGAAGIAAMPAGAPTSERLFAAARIAMEWAVARGHPGHCVYEPGLSVAGFPPASATDHLWTHARPPEMLDRRAAGA